MVSADDVVYRVQDTAARRKVLPLGTTSSYRTLTMFSLTAPNMLRRSGAEASLSLVALLRNLQHNIFHNIVCRA